MPILLTLFSLFLVCLLLYPEDCWVIRMCVGKHNVFVLLTTAIATPSSRQHSASLRLTMFPSFPDW